jgi:hypothetical protein
MSVFIGGVPRRSLPSHSVRQPAASRSLQARSLLRVSTAPAARPISAIRPALRPRSARLAAAVNTLGSAQVFGDRGTQLEGQLRSRRSTERCLARGRFLPSTKALDVLCVAPASFESETQPELARSPREREDHAKSRFSRLIFRISLRMSFDIGGWPEWPRRPFHVQHRRNPYLRATDSVTSGAVQKAEHRGDSHPIFNQKDKTRPISCTMASTASPLGHCRVQIIHQLHQAPGAGHRYRYAARNTPTSTGKGPSSFTFRTKSSKWNASLPRNTATQGIPLRAPGRD